MSIDTVEVLVHWVQDRGAELTIDAADRATANGYKVLMAENFSVQQVIDRGEFFLPIAPIDRITHFRIGNRYRIVVDVRIALVDILGDCTANVIDAAVKLAHHADRRTVQSEGIETYFSLFE